MKQQSLNDYTLPQLKQLATEFDLSPEEVGTHGDLRCRSTWIEAIQAAQRMGKTTQEYRELPLVKAIAAQTREEKPKQPEPELWCDDLKFTGQLEDFFLQLRRSHLLVPTDQLKAMPILDKRFEKWIDWIVPGNLFATFRQNRVYQILMIDTFANVFYLPTGKPQLMTAQLSALRKFVYPVSLPKSGRIVEAAQYIKLLHEATEEPDCQSISRNLTKTFYP